MEHPCKGVVGAVLGLMNGRNIGDQREERLCVVGWHIRVEGPDWKMS